MLLRAGFPHVLGMGGAPVFGKFRDREVTDPHQHHASVANVLTQVDFLECNSDSNHHCHGGVIFPEEEGESADQQHREHDDHQGAGGQQRVD